MRPKIIFIFFLFVLPCFGAVAVRAQNYFIVRANKDSLDGFMPFYDTDATQVKGMISFVPELKLSDHSLNYGFQVKSNKDDRKDIIGDTLALVNHNFDFAIPINDTFIKSGNYRLVFRLVDKISNEIKQEQDFNFQTLRTPSDFYQAEKRAYSPLVNNKIFVPGATIDVSKTFVSKYDLKAIKRNIYALAPIAEKPEQTAAVGILAEDNLEQMQLFFYNFWSARNAQNPEAQWRDYAEKLNYTSRKYSYGVLKGYQTDRGRLYLKYGPPSREIKASSERGARPYELWFYNELDKWVNLSILFVQLGALPNERVMLHSTDPSFLNNPAWASQLFTEISEMNNKNAHRVYEFFK